jgi:preprotein translocase subunit SecG
MAIFHNFIQIVQIIAALTVIGLVLVQHGKGADMGAAFGSGASGSVFGATGSANFLSRSTAIAAATFFTATLLLVFVTNGQDSRKSVIQSAIATPIVPTDVTPATLDKKPAEVKASDVKVDTPPSEKSAPVKP